MSDELLLEDHSRTDGLSALGTAWQFFTDRVMGGVSSGFAAPESLDGRACIRLRGEVSLENNGGFIQVALPLGEGNGTLDAHTYTGIRLVVRGNGENYFVHLRTADTRLPWQYYQASFETSASWTSVDLPFAAFRGENLEAPLEAEQLRRLAIVAAKRKMSADVSVARISLYR